MKKSILRILVSGSVVLLSAMVVPAATATQTAPNAASDDLVTPAALSKNIRFNSSLGDIARMAQLGVKQDTLLAYINNCDLPFKLSADDITYLNDLAVPNAVETAMIQHDKELGITTDIQSPDETVQVSEVIQQPQGVTESYFYSTLTPYGSWVNIPGYGICWQPCAGTYNTNWTPYCTRGHWVYSDSGWYWVSGYSWGWCTFHYGRWFHDIHRGWCWWPNTTWAPSWVFWRVSRNYCGWASLPPNCIFRQGTGLVLNGEAVAADSDFGIGANFFTFVPMIKIFDARLEHYRVKQASGIFRRSKVYNNISFNDRTIVNEGIPERRIAGITGVPTLPYKIQATASISVPGEQVPPKEGRTLAISRPVFDGNAPADLNNGIQPTPQQDEPEAYHSMSQALQVRDNPQKDQKTGVQTNTYWSLPPQTPPVNHRPAFSPPKFEEPVPTLVSQPENTREFERPPQQ